MAASSTKKKRRLTARNADRHVLYEAAVQVVEADIEFLRRAYRKVRGKKPTRLREDFCGTAKLATEWVKLNRANEAWGVDLDPEVLDWARTRRLAPMGDAASRVHLFEDDVMTAKLPPVDITAAFNFSYSIFKQREPLRQYFESVLAGLDTEGVFVLDMFGGTDSFGTLDEDRVISGERGPDGKKIPKFTYEWEHAKFNPVTNEILCHIHFRFRDGSRVKKAFTYDWRLWTIPELCELLAEAGFSESHVYTHGWDEDAESDGVYRKKTRFENEKSWLAYIVAAK